MGTNGKRQGLVALMFVLSVMSYLDRTAMSIAAPSIIREFAISETAMGTVFSAFLLGYTAFMTPAGAWADRVGARLALVVSGLGTALFTGLTAVSSAVPVFLGVRLAMGVFTAPLYPACGRVVSNWVAVGRRAQTQAFILSGSAIGAAIAPPAIAAIIAGFGWRAAFAAAAAATTLFTLVWYIVGRDHPSGVAARASAPVTAKVAWKHLARNRNLLLLTTGYFFLNYFEYIFLYWIYYYFGEIRHMGATESAYYVTALFVTMAIMMPLGGWTSDRLIYRLGRRRGARIVPIVGVTLSSVLLFAGAHSAAGPVVTISLLALALGFCATAEGPYWGSAMLVGKDNAGAACGILNAGGNLGGMVAPVVTPMVAARFGWAAGLYVASALVLVAVVVWFWISLESDD